MIARVMKPAGAVVLARPEAADGAGRTIGPERGLVDMAIRGQRRVEFITAGGTAFGEFARAGELEADGAQAHGSVSFSLL